MATWMCKNGELPYLDIWRKAETPPSYPYWQWQCKGGELPSKQAWRRIPDENPKPYPSLSWVCNGADLPYKTLWRSTVYHVPAVKQDDYICVYDMATLQDDFKNNGLEILMPTSCEITEELNGSYELALTHPIDSTGKWKQLLELNIIKSQGQLFRIYQKRTVLNSDGTREREVHARSIFYDLNDKILVDVRPENKNGHEFLSWVMNHMFDDDPEHNYVFYDYTYTSDITDKATAYYQGVSPVAAMLGEDNCFINRLGGELFRDNFYFSINKRREGAVDHTDAITYSVDMLEIEETVDYTDMITSLKCYDNFGNGFGVQYVPNVRLAHNCTKILHFNYDNFDTAMQQLSKDAMDYFTIHGLPMITYRVVFANLKDTELYKDFLKLQNYNVGDTVPVYCEELDISTIQKVIKKTTNGINGKTISIELGMSKACLTRKDKYSSIIAKNSPESKENKALKEELRQTKLKMLRTWADAEQFTWAEMEQFTVEEVERV